jgi:hypothetical protein
MELPFSEEWQLWTRISGKLMPCSLAKAWWVARVSPLTPSTWALRLPKDAISLWKAISSLVQTGVKSAK